MLGLFWSMLIAALVISGVGVLTLGEIHPDERNEASVVSLDEDEEGKLGDEGESEDVLEAADEEEDA